ncbi:MAG: MipA/OmpV family protein [Arenimonas sp.]|nr:MipA/OmpV family protein [Arenimonas sp.]
MRAPLLVLVLACFCAPAWAQDTAPAEAPAPDTAEPAPSAAPPGQPRWTFGLLALNRNAPYVGLDEDNYLVPLIRFEGERAYLRGLRGGWRVYNKGNFELAAIAQARLDGYDPDDSDFLTGMEKRKFSMDVGMTADWRVKGIGNFEAAVVVDALDRSGGSEVSLGWNGLVRAGQWFVIPGVSGRWQDASMVDYYYGVRADEALPGRPAYRPGAAFKPEVSVLVNRSFGSNRRWSFFARAAHEWLPSNVSDSPIVQGDGNTSIFLGLGYSPR